MTDRREMTLAEADAYDAGCAAGVAAMRAADPRWCVRDKALICASRDCSPERCVRVEGAKTRARPEDEA